MDWAIKPFHATVPLKKMRGLSDEHVYNVQTLIKIILILFRKCSPDDGDISPCRPPKLVKQSPEMLPASLAARQSPDLLPAFQLARQRSFVGPGGRPNHCGQHCKKLKQVSLVECLKYVHCKKVTDFPVSSRDVANQTLHPWRLSQLKSRMRFFNIPVCTEW